MTKFKKFYAGFKKGVHGFGQNIAIIINMILLSFVYLMGVGLTSIIAKSLGKRFLDMKLSKTVSYWYDLNLRKKKIEEYYRQF